MRSRRSGRWALLIVSVLVVLAAGAFWGFTRFSSKGATAPGNERAPRRGPAARETPAADDGQKSASAERSAERIVPAPPAQKTGEDADAPAAAGAARAKAVPAALAGRVAEQFATQRWKECRIGPFSVGYGPDGVPEAYFFIVYLPGAPQKSIEDLRAGISPLRAERVALEKQATAERAAELRPRLKAIWSKIRGDDLYATVVVGANEGREPFIASFGGLPPHVFLREDAIEMRRTQMDGGDPGEPKTVWVPPLFIVFEFPPGKDGKRAYLEARGTELHETQLLDWKRPETPAGVLEERQKKWRSFEDTLDGKPKLSQ